MRKFKFTFEYYHNPGLQVYTTIEAEGETKEIAAKAAIREYGSTASPDFDPARLLIIEVWELVFTI
jgi:hypothetical protein